MGSIKLILKFLGVILLSIILIVILFFVYLTLADYRPKPSEPLTIGGNTNYATDSRRQFTLLSWNIGYCAMGKEADFFYDGGKMTRPSFDYFQKYLNGVYNSVCKADTVDFLFLQEADQDARRSYYIDEVDLLTKGMKDFTSSFAVNYDVDFIPLPLHSPLSKVKAGLLNLMRFKPSSVARIASPVNFSWPKNLFFLDRCMMLSRFPLSNNREMVLINLHNSAFSDGVVLRRHEMELIRSTVTEEYNKGNYVIAGGDWNIAPPGFIPAMFRSGENAAPVTEQIPVDFLPESWKWVFDPGYPTNRDAESAYRKGLTGVHIYDFFLVSPNVQVDEIRTIPNGFTWSDHQPVYLRFSLKDEFVPVDNPVLNNK